MNQFCKNCKYYAGKKFISQGFGEQGKFYECCLIGERTKVFNGYNRIGRKKYKYPIFKIFKDINIAGILYTFENGKLYLAIERLRSEDSCKFFEPRWYIKIFYKFKLLINNVKKKEENCD